MELDELDNAIDVSTDPVTAWLDKAEQSHSRVSQLGEMYHRECRWRKECMAMAIAMGATSVQVAERLGISSAQVRQLTRDVGE